MCYLLVHVFVSLSSVNDLVSCLACSKTFGFSACSPGSSNSIFLAAFVKIRVGILNLRLFFAPKTIGAGSLLVYIRLDETICNTPSVSCHFWIFNIVIVITCMCIDKWLWFRISDQLAEQLYWTGC